MIVERAGWAGRRTRTSNMTKTIAVVALAALAAGCTKTEKITADEARNALPQAAAIQIGTPADTAAARAQALVIGAQTDAGAAPTFNPLWWSTSEYARWSYYTAWTVNGGAAWTLFVLRFVTIFPPTHCEESTCTWGPWEESSADPQTPALKIKRWRLVVTKVDDGHFEYTLSAENMLDPQGYVSIVTGVAFPKDPWRGHGEFTINFDNARQLPEPKEDYGVLTIRYDNESGLAVDATLVGGRSAEDRTKILNAAYAFDATATGGELQVAFETRDDVSAIDRVSLRSRWDATGAGRGDAKVFLTEAPWTFNYEASECWDGRVGGFDLTYDTDPSFGAVESCPAAFQTALYSDLVVP
jgi:hypothetical protein